MSNPNYYTDYTTTNNASEWGKMYMDSSLVPQQPNGYYCTTVLESIKLSEPLKEGIEMKNLYEVFLVYGEDRKVPFISATERVIANDDEDARVKSGIYSKIEKEWDADYLTILVRNLGAVKIKEKAKEVKNV